MSVIKQKGVGSAAHLRSLSRYLDDERALMRGTQNLSRFENWEKECEKASVRPRRAREGRREDDLHVSPGDLLPSRGMLMFPKRRENDARGVHGVRPRVA